MSTELDLDHAIKAALADLVEAAPDTADEPNRLPVNLTNDPAPGRVFAVVAAAFLIVAGTAAVAVVARTGPIGEGPAASPQPPRETAAPTASSLSEGATLSAEPPTSCVPAGQTTSVPNVAGLPYLWAIDALGAAGLESDAIREAAPDGTSGSDEQYTIVEQNVVPLEVVACGSVIVVTAAYRPGRLRIVEPGDTYDSIAAVEGLPVELLLDYNGLTTTELQAAGVTTIDPLDVGRAIRLTQGPAPQRFVVADNADGLVVTDIVDRDPDVVSLVLGGDRFAGVTLQVHIVPGQYAEPPTNFEPEPIEVRQTTGVIVRPPDGSVSLLWQEDDELAIELAGTPTGDSAVMPTGVDLVEIAGRLIAVNDTEWAEYRAQQE